jgi:prophage antirepressor-like protein
VSHETANPGLQVFDFDGAAVRLVLREGQLWWVASDVARVLGLHDATHAVRGLDDDEKGLQKVETPGGIQSLVVVSEPGLYSLLVRSNKPEAKRFRRWVTHEVIPAIRRTGGYSVEGSAMWMIPKTYPDALRKLADQVEATAAAEAKAAALAAPARSWETLAHTNRDYSVGDAAKILSRDPAIEIGRQRLFAALSELGMVFVEKEGRRNVYKPRQEHVNAERLRLRMGGLWQHPETLKWNVGIPQLRITAKGLAYVRKKLCETGALQLDDRDEPAANSNALGLAS